MKLISCLLVSLLATLSHAEKIAVDEIVATVNNNVILLSELEYKSKELSAQQKVSPDLVANDALNLLILERLQLDIAENNGLEISDEEINGAMAQIAQRNNISYQQLQQYLLQSGEYHQFRQNTKDQLTLQYLQRGAIAQKIFISEQEIDALLSSTQGATLAQKEYRLAYTRFNSEQEAKAFTKQFANTAILEQVDAAKDLGWRKLSDVPSMFRESIAAISDNDFLIVENNKVFHIAQLLGNRDAESGESIRQYRFRHILIRNQQTRDDAAAIKLATKLRQQIIDGDSFDALARQYSDDPGSKAKGGVFEWSDLDGFVAEFSDAIRTSELNQVTDLVKTQFGYHLIEVLEQREMAQAQQIARENARNQLFQTRFAEELTRWHTSLRNGALIDIKLESLK